MKQEIEAAANQVAEWLIQNLPVILAWVTGVLTKWLHVVYQRWKNK